MAKCSGRNCPMQHNTINVSECKSTETCPWFTPEIIYCSCCRVFPATQEKAGIPVCGICKCQLDMAEQFSKLQEDISKGFRKIEEEISGKR